MNNLREKARWVFAVIAVLLVLPAMRVSAAEEDDDDGEDIAISKVPAVVLEAAQKAVPGIELQEAEKKTKSEGEFYELNGKLKGVEYEIVVSADGKSVTSKVDEEDDDEEMTTGGKGNDDDEDDDDDDDEEDDD